MKYLALAAILVTGCDAIGIVVGDVTHKPNQEAAIALVWHDLYGQSGPPPTVRWVEGAGLNCHRAEWDEGQRGFLIAGVKCVDGITWSSHQVSLTWAGWRGSFAYTSLAHEFMHAAQFRKGIFDVFHYRDEWTPLAECEGQGERCGLVETAEMALRGQGL